MSAAVTNQDRAGSSAHACRAFLLLRRRIHGEPPDARGLSKELGIDRTEVIRSAWRKASRSITARSTRPSSRHTRRWARAHQRRSPRRSPVQALFRAGTRSRAALQGGSRALGGLLAGDLGDALLERLHEIDDRRLGRLFHRLGDLLACELRLEHLPQVGPVLARQISLVELAGEAVDHLTRQVQLGLFDLAVGDGLLDLCL